MKREKYSSDEGIIHGLRSRQIAKNGFYKIEDKFLKGLSHAIIDWLDLIIKEKVKINRQKKICHYDLRLYGKDLYQILTKVQRRIKK